MLRPILASLRVANAPSVVSNVALGFLLGHFLWVASEPLLPTLGRLAAAALLLYSAGNLANDWFDFAWDRQHRPERALPRGICRPRSYLIAAILTALAGLTTAFTVATRAGLAAAGIVLAIGLYTAFHKRSVWAVLPMGLCRGGLYLMGFLAAWPTDLAALTPPTASSWSQAGEVLRSAGFIGLHALGLAAYIIGLSLTARSESLPATAPGQQVLARALLLLPWLALSCAWIPSDPLCGWLALVPFTLWTTLSLTLFRRPVARLVSALLAGIPLVDAIAAIPLAAALTLPDQPLPTPAWIALGLPPAAFGCALLLQKASPAT